MLLILCARIGGGGDGRREVRGGEAEDRRQIGGKLGDPADDSSCLSFGDPQAALYWTATTFTGTPSLAWIVFTGDGDLHIDSKSLGFRVRAVRGGS